MLYIIILSALVLYVSVRLILIKKEMKRITAEMRSNEDGHTMSVDLVDKDLQDMILEVNRLYGRIMEIKSDGKKKEKAIKDSVSMISHDMRTPLTSVIGYLQMAKRSADNGDIYSNIDTALERAVYLNRLVNDFFELSLISSGQAKAVCTRVDLADIICEEIFAQSPEIDKRGIEPRFEQADMNIYVEADRKMLTRVLQNLISNAVRYTRSRLDITIDAAEDITSFSIVTDTDEKVDTERIFDMFYMEDASRHRGGTGLGLYIVKQFAESMGGSIRAEQDAERFEIIVSLRSSGMGCIDEG